MPAEQINKALFQSQMGLTGHDAVYTRFRKVIKAVAFKYLGVNVGKITLTKDSWAAFTTELQRLFTAFRDQRRGPARMKSPIFFANSYIESYRRAPIRKRQRALKRAEVTQEIEKANQISKATFSVKSALPTSPPSIMVGSSMAPPRENEDGVLDFLEGCNPPLAFLLPHFLEAGVEDPEWILAMQKWPRLALRNFCARWFNFKPDRDGGYKTYDDREITLQALLIGFQYY
ncbi:hypothetical protein B0H16DRAFT_1514467 [Mycena metata]|uniref:Uncharacterized protein n=1 Tax=Mycena metata TaxID=1033252 RepID=A0AAD7JWC6_9AGAR|nr:hypothetical protein B0H16DRAFT_1514467 [Mycena metata]